MYICICNPFTDKDVKKHLNTHGEKTTVSKVYSACSGGEKMNCGNCACDLKSMVIHHNNAMTIETISDKMEQIAPADKKIEETV